jgi:uncharacterized protein
MAVVNFEAFGRQLTFDPRVLSHQIIDDSVFPKPCSLALDISGSCNLACSYCAENLTMPPREPMQLETLNRALDSIFRWSDRKRGVSLHLGSGEPLLNPMMVKDIDEKARALAKKNHQQLSLYLTTNGTLLNNEIEDWLAAGDWNLKISIDGDHAIHDRYRLSKSGGKTFTTVEKAVKRLAKRMPDHFSTTSVLCHGTDPKDVFYAIASMGVKRIEIVPIAAAKASKFALRQNDFEEYRHFIFDYAQRISKGEEVPVNIRFH